MSGVELYDNTARSLSGLDSSLQSRGTSDGIVDVKLRQFFEDAKKGDAIEQKKKGISQRVMEIRNSLFPTSVTYSGEFLS